MQISFKHKNKKINLDVKSCNFIQRFVGLMFSRREKSKALLFDFKKPTKEPIHSLFIFYDFLVIWLNNKNNVINLKIIKPFTFFIKPKKPFLKLIEIPINSHYKETIKLLVDKQKI